MDGLAGRVALVTGCGAADGIGFATARALAQAGARVAITSTTARIHDRLAELGPELGPALGSELGSELGPEPGCGHAAFIADLTDSASVARLVAAVARALGAPPAILVNNAGMVQQGHKHRLARIEKVTDADWAAHLAINATTAFNMTRAVLPAMQRAGYGRIVNVASVTGPLVTIARAAGYSAAKAAMTGLTRATALENAARGITCNAVLPGWIATGSSSAREIAAGRRSPTGRPGTPAEVAYACLFLASAGAGYINGAMLVVDGANSLAEMK